MDLSEVLVSGNVLATLRASSKKHVLQDLAEFAAQATGIDPRRVFDVLLARERLGSTGIGDGIAIPHGRVADLDRMHAFFARLEEPVDFDAVDGAPVDLVFLLLAPEDAGTVHLKTLARVSRLLRDRVLCDKLRGTRAADALYAMLTETATLHAA